MTERSYTPTLSWYRRWIGSQINITVWIAVTSIFAVTLLGAELVRAITITSQIVVIGFGITALWSSSALGLLLLFYAHGKRQQDMTD